MNEQQLIKYKAWLKTMSKDARVSFNERVIYKTALDKLNDILGGDNGI